MNILIMLWHFEEKMCYRVATQLDVKFTNSISSPTNWQQHACTCHETTLLS